MLFVAASRLAAVTSDSDLEWDLRFQPFLTNAEMKTALLSVA